MLKSLKATFLSFGLLSLIVGCGSHNNTSSESQSNKVRFMPENDLYLEDTKDAALLANDMTETVFNSIIDEVSDIYSPIVKSHGAKLIIEKNWDDSTVNAYAYQEGTDWYVAMFGGLARRSEITLDGFAMVVCHELGHHLGGFPISEWAAIEGQSDYFALHACARNLWKNEDNSKYADNVDAYAKSLCKKYFNNTSDLNLCYREMQASWSIASLLAALNNNSKIKFDTPDKTVVTKTNPNHPKAQCRLDTYVAGSLCAVKWDDYLIPQTASESAKYLCTSADFNIGVAAYDIRARPRCWFKP